MHFMVCNVDNIVEARQIGPETTHAAMPAAFQNVQVSPRSKYRATQDDLGISY